MYFYQGRTNTLTNTKNTHKTDPKKFEKSMTLNNYLIAHENYGDHSSSYQYYIELRDKSEKLSKERQEILTRNPNFKQRITKLYNETIN